MAETTTYRFEWVDDDEPLLGGQWVARGDETARPVVLADAVAAQGEEALHAHVKAVFAVVEAAGALEDELLPHSVDRLGRALVASEAGEPEIDPNSADGERVQTTAAALEKLAADLAELVDEQLCDDGSLSTLPPDSTHALCAAVQAAWRLRHRVAPPGPLFL